jgi:hypothetical protein
MDKDHTTVVIQHAMFIYMPDGRDLEYCRHRSILPCEIGHLKEKEYKGGENYGYRYGEDTANYRR